MVESLTAGHLPKVMYCAVFALVAILATVKIIVDDEKAAKILAGKPHRKLFSLQG